VRSVSLKRTLPRRERWHTIHSYECMHSCIPASIICTGSSTYGSGQPSRWPCSSRWQEDAETAPQILHRRHDEYQCQSSKTCVFCFKTVQLARPRRLVGGNIKFVKVHGAVERVNPACPSLKCGYTIKPRDPHAAICIAIAGASNLFSSPPATLPPSLGPFA
jgi:hypothetical protein